MTFRELELKDVFVLSVGGARYAKTDVRTALRRKSENGGSFEEHDFSPETIVTKLDNVSMVDRWWELL